MNGSKEFTLNEITSVLEKSAVKTPKTYKSFLDLSLSDFVEEFFTGIAHDKNFVKMAKFFESDSSLRRYLIEEDFFGKKGL